MKNLISKEKILESLDVYETFNHYLRPFHKNAILQEGKHISNPFLSQKQKTPSFNIYKNAHQSWRYKDFATNDGGDIFDLVQQLFKCDFQEALRLINNDFALGLSEASSFRIEEEAWTIENSSYWREYGIEISTLVHFNVHPIKEYKRVKEDDTTIRVQSTLANPMYAYHIAYRCYKIYNPKSKKYKFSWLGVKPTDYIFGLKQLPPNGKQVFITGGEKDVMTLYANQYSAICLNSETAMPSSSLIEELKRRFDEVIVLYDIDKTGIEQSIKLCKKFGLKRMTLPSSLQVLDVKDVSDLYKVGYHLHSKDITIEDYQASNLITPHPHLRVLLATQQKLAERKAEDIQLTPPILTLNGNGIVFPRTINIIQGKAGVHKSRLAETLCSAFIQRSQAKGDFLGFDVNQQSQPTVCYVDTERNHSEQFPYALQQILLKAGYQKEDSPAHFDFISLLEIPRKERFNALTQYLTNVRERFSGHLIIILDVVTDCIRDFNRSEDSMQLIDLMNESINKYNVTFIGLIHENPGSADKARGHLGTELMNKSSTVIQIGFEKGKNNQPTNLIALNFLKTRSTGKPETLYLQYCNESKGLILADEFSIHETMNARKIKAGVNDIMKDLVQVLQEKTSSQQLITVLSKRFDCSDKIVRNRLKEIHDKKYALEGDSEGWFHLIKEQEGKEVYYSLSCLSSTSKMAS